MDRRIHSEKVNTPIGVALQLEGILLGGYSHTLPIWVCAVQRGRDFKPPGLERGIHFRGIF